MSTWELIILEGASTTHWAPDLSLDAVNSEEEEHILHCSAVYSVCQNQFCSNIFLFFLLPNYLFPLSTSFHFGSLNVGRRLFANTKASKECNTELGKHFNDWIIIFAPNILTSLSVFGEPVSLWNRAYYLPHWKCVFFFSESMDLNEVHQSEASWELATQNPQRSWCSGHRCQPRMYSESAKPLALKYPSMPGQRWWRNPCPHRIQSCPPWGCAGQTPGSAVEDAGCCCLDKAVVHCRPLCQLPKADCQIFRNFVRQLLNVIQKTELHKLGFGKLLF